MQRVRKVSLAVVLAVLFVGICIGLRGRLARYGIAAWQRVRGRKTVADRVEQFGPAVRARLAPHFNAAGASYPPSKLVFAGLKKERVFEVWASDGAGPLKLVRTYAIVGVSGALGPKLKEGDCQVPEGLYRIESLNPNSMFHLSLRVNYPNEFDREQARRESRSNLGGDIMIHGGTASIGCLAMGDQAAEDLFVLAAETGIENISVVLSPVDLRKTPAPSADRPLPVWADRLYADIASRLRQLGTQ